MLEDSAYDLVGELQGDWVDQFSIKENVETIVGTGTNGQCEGILTASGIGEVVSGAAAAVTTDGLIDLYYALKSAYSKNASFILQRSSLAAIRKLKLADGSYVWQPGIIQTQPNTILNSTYHEMPDMPAIAANAYPIAYGDWKRAYVIVDRLGLSMQTDFITLADYGIVVFRARRRVGGGVMVGDAYKKLKISV
jgi:HK97 family phage major capsid protein